MKAFSVRQPWAWLIVNGHKRFENREWQPRNPCRRFRGRVLIHASKGMTREEYLIGADHAEDYGITLPPMEDLDRGGIVGETEIVDWHDRAPDLPFAFTSGLELRNSRPLPFRPCKGALGFFHAEGGAS